MKKILFPTDFSEASANALQFTLKLAKAFSAVVDVLHLYQVPLWLEDDVAPELVLQRIEQMGKAAAEEVRSFTQAYDSKFLGKTMAINSTTIAREIVTQAENGKYDLICMGMQGEHAALEKIMGSVTTRTLKQATCPVLTIPAEASFKSIHKIAYATDLDTSDLAAVEQLMTFAGLLGAEVHFVHIETQPDLGKMEDRVQLENYPFEYVDFTIVNHPSIVKGLDLYTQEKGIDVLVFFTPKRRLWDRIFHVSVTKRMAFHSEIPLLVLHSSQRKV